MATPAWEPGKLYAPGALVVPRSTPPTVVQAIANAGFEDGNVGWGTGGALAITTAGAAGRPAYQGTHFATFTGSGQIVLAESVAHDARPGQSISISAYVRMPGSGDTAGARAVLVWYNSSDALISISPVTGGAIVNRTGGAWRAVSATAQAPAGTAYVRAGVSLTINSGGGYIDVDGFSWNYVPPVTAGLQYKAVQPTIGTSAAAEPAWPPTVGVQVVDNDVIWEAVLLSRVVYEARPILRSGMTEPDWPEQVGAFVVDNTISWETASRQVTEAPNSKVVAITASKVFAADKDIIRYSATVNPLDWSSQDNAGYLPSGLNQNGSNDTAVLNIYRSNLVAFSSSTFQNWQVDEDPANMELLDVMEGIGSTWQHAAQPVARDLFYLAALGVRTVGISGGSLNLVNGDAGMPIDPLVRAAIRAAEANVEKPLGMYYPSLGQYMLAFPDYPPSHVAIHGDLELAGVNLPIPAFTYTGTGGVMPYSFALINDTSMPPGLTLNPDGSVTGTPTETGEFSWDVQITDAFGDTDWKTDTAQIVLGPSISGAAPDGALGIAYAGYAYTIGAGAAPIASVTIISGSLPPGTEMDSDGVIDTGVPSALGGFTYTIRVMDENDIYADLTDTVNILGVSFAGTVSGDGVLIVSATGESWGGSIDSELGEDLVLLKAAGGNVYALGATAGRVSQDFGQTWADVVYSGSFDTLDPVSIAYADGVWILVFTNGDLVGRSEDGITFEPVTISGEGRSWGGSFGNEDTFIVGSTQARAYISHDKGLTWDFETFGGVTSSIDLVYRHLDAWVLGASAANNNYALISSLDNAATWTVRDAGVSSIGYKTLISHGESLIFGVIDDFYRTEDLGATYEVAGSFVGSYGSPVQDNNITFNGRYIITGVVGDIFISEGAASWTLAHDSGALNWQVASLGGLPE